MSRHYLQEWVSNRRILACRFTTLSAQAIEQWYEETQAAFENWPDDEPLRLILDARLAGGVPSPHALFRSGALAQVRPDLRGRTAILMEPNTPQALIAQLVEAVTRDAPQRERQFFTDESAAVNWLLAASMTEPDA
jgi:hypothetical protein